MAPDSKNKLRRIRPKPIEIAHISAPSPPAAMANVPFDFSGSTFTPSSGYASPGPPPSRPARPAVGLNEDAPARPARPPTGLDEPAEHKQEETDQEAGVVVAESHDGVGDIQFRLPQRAPIRTLYGGASSVSPRSNRFVEARPSSILSTYYTPEMGSAADAQTEPASPVKDGRRPSLVNPEDYMPGLPVNSNTGKAMAAGFEPPALPSLRLSSYTPHGVRESILPMNRSPRSPGFPKNVQHAHSASAPAPTDAAARRVKSVDISESQETAKMAPPTLHIVENSAAPSPDSEYSSPLPSSNLGEGVVAHKQDKDFLKAYKIGSLNLPEVDLDTERRPSFDFDLADSKYDAKKIYGSTNELEAVLVPTLFVDNGQRPPSPAAPSSKLSKSRSSGGFSRAADSMPRDPITGKIDWRARLQISKEAPSGLLATPLSAAEDVFMSPGSEKPPPSSDGSRSSGEYDEKKPRSGYFPTLAYSVRKPTPQIVELPPSVFAPMGKTMLRLSPLTFFIAQAAMVFYLYIRAKYTYEAAVSTNYHFAAAWLFWASEALTALWTGLRGVYQLSKLRIRGKPRYAIRGDLAVPTVDVLVLCTGQDSSIVMDATIAAARLDWPVDRLRVLVIDETHSNSLKLSVENYSNSRAIHVTYHRRNKNSLMASGLWHKSSTVNFGLAETRAEGRISGDFVLILEAQSIPEPDMLRTMLPHMIKDPLLSMVQTPSGLYNLPNKLGMSFGTFIRCVEPVEDSHTGLVVRRSAIDDIGGFPTRSSVEDRRLECLLKGKGYKTLWIDETLQYSLVPDSFSKHLRQRVNRSLAHIGTAARLGFFLFGRRTRYMSLGDRLAGMGRALAPFVSIIVLLNVLAFPICLIVGGFLIPALSMGELNVLIWAAVAVVLSERLHDFFFTVPTGEASTRRFIQSQVFMAPYIILGLFRKCIPDFLCRGHEQYWNSSSIGETKERDSKVRKPLHKRLLSVLFGTHGWGHLLIIFYILGAVGWSLYGSLRPYALRQRSLHQTGLLLVMTVAWPTLPWVNILLGSAIPFVYAISPPTVASRDRLLLREPISGVARPLPAYKRTRPFREGWFRQLCLSVLLVGYTCAVFSLTLKDLHIGN